jgi:biopolymer transport protein ExbD
MAFGGPMQPQGHRPIREINMVPLIDVMLVLLIIFIITAPILTHAVNIKLPQASSNPELTKVEDVRIGIRQNGDIYWGADPVSQEELSARLSKVVGQDPQPALHINADRQGLYEPIAQVMSIAGRMGFNKIALVTEPVK